MSSPLALGRKSASQSNRPDEVFWTSLAITGATTKGRITSIVSPPNGAEPREIASTPIVSGNVEEALFDRPRVDPQPAGLPWGVSHRHISGR